MVKTAVLVMVAVSASIDTQLEIPHPMFKLKTQRATQRRDRQPQCHSSHSAPSLQHMGSSSSSGGVAGCNGRIEDLSATRPTTIAAGQYSAFAEKLPGAVLDGTMPSHLQQLGHLYPHHHDATRLRRCMEVQTGILASQHRVCVHMRRPRPHDVHILIPASVSAGALAPAPAVHCCCTPAPAC